MNYAESVFDEKQLAREDNIAFLRMVGFDRYASDADFWIRHAPEGHYKFKQTTQDESGCDWEINITSHSGVQMYAECNFDNIKETFFRHKEVLALMLKNEI